MARHRWSPPDASGHLIAAWRVHAGVTALVSAALISTLAAQSRQPPVFRTGVELLEVDATVVDDRSRPVTDLSLSDFVVTVDGKPRRVVSAEFARTVDLKAGRVTGPTAAVPAVSFNDGRSDGRLIVLAIDLFNTRPAQSRAIALALERLLDRLPPGDRVALVAFPGPIVDFTTDRAAIRDRLALVTGVSALDGIAREFNISRAEAVAVDTQTEFETIRRLAQRECHVTLPENILELLSEMVGAEGCMGTLLAEAESMASDINHRSDGAIGALTDLLRRLGQVEGRKTLVLVSEGIILGGLRSNAVPMLADMAAEARVDVNVVLPQGFAMADAERSGPQPTPVLDQRLTEDALEDLVARSRGAVFRAPAGLDAAFDRLHLELSGYYALGVETSPSDRNGNRHRISVQVRRRGVTVRARREFRYQASARTSQDDLMERLLRSPLTVGELPVRLTTYTFREAGSSKSRVVLAAEITPVGMEAVDLRLGFSVFDPEGRVVASGGERKTLASADGRAIEYDGSILLDPGTYTLRFGVVDPAGNRGSVERPLRLARPANQPVVVSDMMLAGMHEAKARALRPRVELQVDASRLAAYMELYADRPERFEGTEVTMEVAYDESSMAIRRERARLEPRGDGRRGEVLLSIPVDGLAAGHYVVRATVSAGGRTVGTSVRPFELLASVAASAGESAAAASVPVTVGADTRWASPVREAEQSPPIPVRRWVPFEADFVRIDPGTPRKAAGTYRRASDGSVRVETDMDDATRAVVFITNIAKRVQYQLVNGRWSSYPVKVPPDGFGPPVVQAEPHRFSPAPPVEGFEVLRFVNAQGLVLFEAPKLDYFALVTENPAGGRDAFSNVRVGEQSAEWFEPPSGTFVEARSDWRGAVFYRQGPEQPPSSGR